ncbi:hypothetical protein EDB89DRAFT_2044360 [Lactarius sanguifluus]|nr:hypothetical protein EDB89DRAFT_2044360 [Lactarius sanguifluus]
MVCKSPPTNSVDSLFYGVPGVMGYPPYGIRGVQLYHSCLDYCRLPPLIPRMGDFLVCADAYSI